jgi:hypothetical protein
VFWIYALSGESKRHASNDVHVKPYSDTTAVPSSFIEIQFIYLSANLDV